MAKEYYAHSLDGKPKSQWQTIEAHLKNVAESALSFAADFNAGEWAYLAGLWHDIGKYSAEFQRRINSEDDVHSKRSDGTDHSTAGAQHAGSVCKQRGRLLAYAIAGHHAGLPDGTSDSRSCLTERLEKKIPSIPACPDKIRNLVYPESPPFKLEMDRLGFQLSFFTRMIYSCLVDADFLDTEEFMEPEKGSWRKGWRALDKLNDRLEKYLEELKSRQNEKEINGFRTKILEHCLSLAEMKQGLFTLTVPTGGGKTLSSLAFAFRHALKNELKRIIYVIPYTSIIEQNAEVFRKILGGEAVLEHHSNFRTPADSRDNLETEDEYSRSRLASENWDAPLIVTTNVQFFESLFHNRSSRCRKLHNIANSIVILDEAQMLPVPLLRPCVEALRELSSTCGTSIVLCTATQPALSDKDVKWRLEKVHEIAPNPRELYTAFKRVNTKHLGKLSDDDLAENLTKHKKVLCIVNTRKHARIIYEKMKGSKNLYHLSALMCPAHRSEKLEEIKKTLADSEECRVVSTQLIEAGVDIDFPVVYRSAAGIDSIAQAAGRCNRENRLHPKMGDVYVFTPENGLPPGDFQRNADVAEMVMRKHDDDPLSIEAVEEYFRTQYFLKGEKELDKHGIMEDLEEDVRRCNFPFKQIASKFKIIENGQESIIIPWKDKAEYLIEKLRYSEFPANFARKLQRFTIQVFPGIIAELEGKSVERIHDRFCVLINPALYHEDLGLCPDDPYFLGVEHLIVS